jgi:hypothetical protein
VKAKAVSPATTWCRDRVVLYVMHLCHKTTSMYCCEDYMDYHYDLYVLNLNCYCFVVLSCCMYPVLEAPHPGRQPKQGLYKKI